MADDKNMPHFTPSAPSPLYPPVYADTSQAPPPVYVGTPPAPPPVYPKAYVDTPPASPPVYMGTPPAPPPVYPQAYVDTPPAPPPVYMGTPVAAEWSTDLFDCTSDITNCCITYWCPCITFGQIAEIIDRGSSSCGLSGALYFLITAFIGCPCVYSCSYRTKLRSQYGLPEAPCADFLTHCFCEACALCQEYRELNHRGFNVSMGWQGNMQAQQPGVAAPPVMAGMQR